VVRHNYSAQPSDKGLNMMEFLLCRGISRPEALGMFERGLVMLNGEVAESDMEIKLSDSVLIKSLKKKRLPKVVLPTVLYEDDHIVAYDKPSDRLVVADRSQMNTGLLGELRAVANKPEGPPYLLHRLDRGTSGVWIVAKTLEAKKFISQQFVDNQVKKQYRAIVQGVFFEKEGEVDVSIAPHPKHPTKMITGKGKASLSRYKLLRQYRHYAVVRVWPQTGRTHQVRLHMKHLGHPLLIDDFYGGFSEFFLSKIKPNYKTAKKRAEKPLISRLTLHCEAMELMTTPLGSTIRIESPLAKDLQRLERNLQNYD